MNRSDKKTQQLFENDQMISSGPRWGTTSFAKHCYLVFRFVKDNSYLVFPNGVKMLEGINIGRSYGADNASAPDIDLTTWDAGIYGVSRHHAHIIVQDKYLCITDMGSTNGTWVNDIPLIPYKHVLLRDGDGISFGKLNCQVHYYW